MEQRPGTTLVIHDQAAHAINFSHPKTLAGVVRSWLADEPMRSRELSLARSLSWANRAAARLPRMTRCRQRVRTLSAADTLIERQFEYSIGPMTLQLDH